MGGARCSYKNCPSKSDKRIHLFHFPVFDKVRCHQWITNAQKLNFLDLKLSQLKNRVICEHHFTDDSFMNSTKGKLKHTAVPTEDGPFCVPEKVDENENEDREIAISLEDIENDHLTNFEKRAHFSVKYGDFLNNDISEPINLQPSYKSTLIQLQDDGMVFNRNADQLYSLRSPHKNVTSYNSILEKCVDTKPRYISKVLNKKIANSESSLCDNNQLPNPKVMAIEFEDLNLNETKQGNKTDKVSTVTPPEAKITEMIELPSLPRNNAKLNSKPIPKNKKVKIISEKSISGPLNIVKGELRPVSPSVIVSVPDKRNRSNIKVDNDEIKTYYVDFTNLQQTDHDQKLDNSDNKISQPAITDQSRFMTDYNQSTIQTDQIDAFNNLNVHNSAELTENRKQIVYNTLEDNSKQLKQEIELLTDVKSMPVVSNFEFVCRPNEQSVFTLPDTQQVLTLFTDPNLLQDIPTTVHPTEIHNPQLLPTESEAFSGVSVNAEQNSSVNTQSKIPQSISNREKLTNTQNNLRKQKLPLTQSPTVNKSVLKCRMPPEKLAAIEEKRKFNMKLRDIINSCLNKLDDESDASKLTAATKKYLNDKKVGQHLSSDPSLPTSQENNIAYLEARLQRMENTLLNKIEQNSQRITDLKRNIVKSTSKTSAYTQTYIDTETNKKHLYQQISQFLSPEANSLIYEELFINKCLLSKTEPASKKRKR